MPFYPGLVVRDYYVDAEVGGQREGVVEPDWIDEGRGLAVDFDGWGSVNLDAEQILGLLVLYDGTWIPVRDYLDRVGYLGASGCCSDGQLVRLPETREGAVWARCTSCGDNSYPVNAIAAGEDPAPERDLLLRPGDVLVIGGIVGKFRGVTSALDNIAAVLNDEDRDRVRVLFVPDVSQLRVIRREGEGEPVRVRVEEGDLGGST